MYLNSKNDFSSMKHYTFTTEIIKKIHENKGFFLFSISC